MSNTLGIRLSFLELLVCLSLGLFYLVLTPPPLEAHAPLQRRCGWLSNPTPGNLWLTDRDGEWIIAIQGGYQMPGEWPWPPFSPRQWVITNTGNYGYGCACLTLEANPKSRQVLKIKLSQPLPLATCRQDRHLAPQTGGHS
jgi:hypothetical protein